MNNFYKGGRGLCLPDQTVETQHLASLRNRQNRSNDYPAIRRGRPVCLPFQIGRTSRLNRDRRRSAPTCTVFILIFICCLFNNATLAQSRDIGAADGVEDITPLEIGDTIPEELWNLPLQVVNHPEGKETITLSEYKDKLIILDFWATWCTSCLKAIQSHADLIEERRENVVLIPVTSQTSEVIDAFFQLPVMRDQRFLSVLNKDLAHYFPHRLVPHYAWIGPSGEVSAFTSVDGVNSSTIQDALQRAPLDINSKKDVDRALPLFMDTTLIPSIRKMSSYAVVYRGYVAGLPSGSYFGRYNDRSNRVYLTNVTSYGAVRTLLRKIWDGFSTKRIVQQGTTGSEEKYSGQRFTIDLIDRDLTVNDLSRLALERVNDLSAHDYKLRTVPRDCLILSSISATTEQDEPNRQVSIHKIVNWMDGLAPSSQLVINETHLTFVPVDENDLTELHLDDAIALLGKHGIHVHKEVRMMELCFISDPI